MRFMGTGEWRRQDLMKLILGLFLVYMLLFWVTNWVLWFTKFSFDPGVLAAYYLGDPSSEFGAPPRPVEAMAETSHMHLFAMGMLLLTLTHLVIFLPLPMRVKGSLVVGTFLSALFEQASGWMIRFAGAPWAWVKIVSFVALQAVLLGLVLALMIALVRPIPVSRAEPGTPPSLLRSRAEAQGS